MCIVFFVVHNYNISQDLQGYIYGYLRYVSPRNFEKKGIKTVKTHFQSWAHPVVTLLVNVYITMERSTMLLMGKSTISMAIFNSWLCRHHQKLRSSSRTTWWTSATAPSWWRPPVHTEKKQIWFGAMCPWLIVINSSDAITMVNSD